MNPAVLQGHAAANRLQTLQLVGTLFTIDGLAGLILFGESGLWLALAATLFALLMEPLAVTWLTLALYQALYQAHPYRACRGTSPSQAANWRP